jgi:hypothetical protein
MGLWIIEIFGKSYNTAVGTKVVICDIITQRNGIYLFSINLIQAY